MSVGGLIHLPVTTLSYQRFRPLMGEAYAEVEAASARATELFAGRVVWHVNSTARGGGVAELLQSLLGYSRGAGVDARWAAVEAASPFFEVTKRIHNRLHGSPGDGGELGAPEREIYEETLRESARELARTVRPRDVVFCHDPQTAGLVPPVLETGATVVWRCHVGIDLPNEIARDTWAFLREYVKPAHAYVFSRREYGWEGLPENKTWIVPPSIDAFSPKNQELAPKVIEAIIARAGLGPSRDGAAATFERADGSPGRVDRAAEVDQEAPIPAQAPLLAQVSRWDRLKDPCGVLRGFAEHCESPDAHLLLAGPSVAAVSDDPEGAEVLERVRELRRGLEPDVRARVHLACLPMDDIQENAAIVNAIQRRAQVVVQKSIAEGFGLTVAEAMWKARPVIASRAGGIQDQIVDGVTGVMLEDPLDLEGFGRACEELLGDRERADEIGAAARAWVIERFLGSRHLIQYLRLLDELLSGRASSRAGP
ncbi:MAG: glycosyltransferase [Solirubrobacterales bacterium]|nr:glycosyltransferase [Solirubrobacterales bacterium]